LKSPKDRKVINGKVVDDEEDHQKPSTKWQENEEDEKQEKDEDEIQPEQA